MNLLKNKKTHPKIEKKLFRKDLHIGKILQMKDVKKRWKDAKGREPDENDVEEIFKVRN